MIIMGIDPGIAIVGWGIVDYKAPRFTTLAHGAIQTRAGLEVERRLEIIYDELDKLFKTYRPDAVAVEELFFNTNHTTAIPVAEARGSILLCARKNGVTIAEYTPLQVKSAVVGYGRADKKQVIAMTRDILGLKTMPKLDDTADALAIAVCHAHSAGSRVSQYFNAPLDRSVISNSGKKTERGYTIEELLAREHKTK